MSSIKRLAIIQINEYKEWGISSRRIAVLCEQNRINGVIKKGKTWLIPQDSIKPADARKNNHGQRGVSKC